MRKFIKTEHPRGFFFPLAYIIMMRKNHTEIKVSLCLTEMRKADENRYCLMELWLPDFLRRLKVFLKEWFTYWV